MPKFTCAYAKCAAIVTNELAPYAKSHVEADLKQCNFLCISTDASNLESTKMFPVVVRYFLPTKEVWVRILEFRQWRKSGRPKIERLKGMLFVKYNSKYSCLEFFNMIKTKPELLRTFSGLGKFRVGICFQIESHSKQRWFRRKWHRNARFRRIV